MNFYEVSRLVITQGYIEASSHFDHWQQLQWEEMDAMLRRLQAELSTRAVGSRWPRDVAMLQDCGASLWGQLVEPFLGVHSLDLSGPSFV